MRRVLEVTGLNAESQWTVQSRRCNTAVARVSGELDVARAEELRELLVTDEVCRS